MEPKHIVTKERERFWRFEWDHVLFCVHIHFQSEKFPCTIHIPYSDWIHFQINVSSSFRKRKNDCGQRAMSFMPVVSKPIYHEKIIMKSHIKTTPQVKKTIEETYKVSEEELRLGIKDIVDLKFSEGIGSWVTLTRDEYLKFERDLLEFDKVLSYHLVKHWPEK